MAASSTRGIETTVDSYRKIIDTWFTGARFTIIAAISLMVLIGLALSDYARVSTFPSLIVDKSSHGEFLQIQFNMSFPEVPCKFASVNVHDAFGTNMLNITKTFRKYSIDSTTQETVEEIGDASVVLNAANFHKVSKLHPLMVVKFYAPWCYWSKLLKSAWEEAAKIITERYDTEIGDGILVGEVDCVEETDLCRRYKIQGYPSIRIFRNGSDVIGDRETDHDYAMHESYYGDRDTDSLVKMMEDLVAPVSVKLERPAATKRGCRIEGSMRAKVTRNVIASLHSASDGARVHIALKTRAGRKFLDQ